MNFKKGDKVTVKSRKGKIIISIDNIALILFDKPNKSGHTTGIYNIKEICPCRPIGEQLLFSFMEED